MKPTQQIEIVDEQVTKALTSAESIKNITTPEEYEQAVEFGKKVSKLEKMIDTKEKSITKPINDSLKEIRNMFKPYKEQVSDLKSTIKTKLIDYANAQAKKRAEAEMKIEARVEKGTMREDTAVAKIGQLEESCPDTTGTLTSVLKVEVIDIKDIPAEYLMVNESAIKKAYREGTEVPGVRCYYEKVARL